jgi:hypothetical protein
MEHSLLRSCSSPSFAPATYSPFFKFAPLAGLNVYRILGDSRLCLHFHARYGYATARETDKVSFSRHSVLARTDYLEGPQLFLTYAARRPQNVIYSAQGRNPEMVRPKDRLGSLSYITPGTIHRRSAERLAGSHFSLRIEPVIPKLRRT